MFSMTTEHPWQTAKEDFDCNVLPILEKRGRAIGNDARNGNENSKRVIELYTRLHRSFDPMTLELLKEAMRKLPN